MKPCPWCGSTGLIDDTTHGHLPHFVYCEDCGAAGPRCHTQDSARLAWDSVKAGTHLDKPAALMALCKYMDIGNETEDVITAIDKLAAAIIAEVEGSNE